jgi:hypothetical protein
MERLGRIYTIIAILIATFIGGPLAAGLLISKNFEIFGNKKAARKSIFYGIFFTIFIAIVLFFLPRNIIAKTPKEIIPFFSIVVVAGMVKAYQFEKIKDHLDNGGSKASYWKAAGIGILGLLITLSIIFFTLRFKQ